MKTIQMDVVADVNLEEVLTVYFEAGDNFEVVKDVIILIAEELQCWDTDKIESGIELFTKIAKGE